MSYESTLPPDPPSGYSTSQGADLTNNPGCVSGCLPLLQGLLACLVFGVILACCMLAASAGTRIPLPLPLSTPIPLPLPFFP